MDGEVDNSGIKLSRYSAAKVYFPENGYYSSFPLPPEWIEAFEPSEERAKALAMYEQVGEEMYAYDPDLNIDRIVEESEAKLRKYESQSRKKSRTQLSRVESSRSGFNTCEKVAESILKLPMTTRAPENMNKTQKNSTNSLLPLSVTHVPQNSGTSRLAEKIETRATNSRTHRTILSEAREVIKERIASHKMFRRRNRSQGALFPVGKMYSAKTVKNIKKLKQISQYKNLPNHVFYMNSPYGSLLQATAKLPRIAKHKRSKSESRLRRKIENAVAENKMPTEKPGFGLNNDLT